MGIRAKITSKGQITIPQMIRDKLQLHPGEEIEFDETAPLLQGKKVVDIKKASSTIGCLKGSTTKSSKELLNELRGLVERR